MRRQYIIFFSVIASLLLYTAFKLHESLSTPFWLVLPFMFPLFFVMFGGMLMSRASDQLNDQRWFQMFSSFGTVFIGLWGTFVIFSMVTDIVRIITLGSYHLFQSEGLYYDTLINSFDQVSHFTLPVSMAIVLFGFIEVLRGPVVKSVSVERHNG